MVKKFVNSFYVDNCLSIVEGEMGIKFSLNGDGHYGEKEGVFNKVGILWWRVHNLKPTYILVMLWKRYSDSLNINVSSTYLRLYT